MQHYSLTHSPTPSLTEVDSINGLHCHRSIEEASKQAKVYIQALQSLLTVLSVHLHQSSKHLVLSHFARLLRGEEFDQLGQFLARGVFELACGCGRHGFGEDGEEGRG